jgi:hypothetical protein
VKKSVVAYFNRIYVLAAISQAETLSTSVINITVIQWFKWENNYSPPLFFNLDYLSCSIN